MKMVFGNLLLEQKYMGGGRLIGAIKHRIDNSPVWSDLLKIKHIYMANRAVKVKNGLSTLFWEDTWLKDQLLCVLYPVLYELCLVKHGSVYQFLSRHAQLLCSRWLPPFLFDSWLGLVNEVYTYSFDNTQDEVFWRCNKNGVFSTSSAYN